MTASAAVAVERALPGWRAGRRYGVPAAMVTAVAERRAVGDWRGACAAARIDVDVDLHDVARHHGRELADRVADDLLHLVPDLVRWHLPRRGNGGTGLLQPKLAVPLALYPTDGTMIALRVHTPAHLERPQRLLLRLGPVGYGHTLQKKLFERWDTTRFRWDARCTGDLLRHLGGGDRVPFHTRDGRRLTDAELPTGPVTDADPVRRTERTILLADSGAEEQAWAEAGIEADFGARKKIRWLDVGTELSAVVPTLLPLLLAERERHGHFTALVNTVDRAWREAAVKVKVKDTVRAKIVELGKKDPALVPMGWWSRSPDVELLRRGRITPAALHPLVRAAMFPDLPADLPYEPLAGPDPQQPVPVRCAGGWHQLTWRPDGLHAPSHDADEARREQTLANLGGTVRGCFAVVSAWRGPGRLPGNLNRLRGHLIAAVAHDDVAEVERLLAAGVDPVGVHDRVGRTLLHGVGRLGRPDLVSRLVAAGVDVNARDRSERTPLLSALFDGASADVVRALLDAGADPHALSDMEAGALHLCRSRDAARIVPWLVAAGLSLEKFDLSGRTPLLCALVADAPPEAIRALLDAGAKVTASNEYLDETVADAIRRYKRDDLAFLAEAYRAEANRTAADDDA